MEVDAKSGEGLVFVFTGPGELMMQSRNPDDIISYVVANMPGATGTRPADPGPTSLLPS